MLQNNFLVKNVILKMCLCPSQKNYRQHIDKLKYSQVTDTPDIVQARINAQQFSNVGIDLLSNSQMYCLLW